MKKPDIHTILKWTISTLAVIFVLLTLMAILVAPAVKNSLAKAKANDRAVIEQEVIAELQESLEEAEINARHAAERKRIDVHKAMVRAVPQAELDRLAKVVKFKLDSTGLNSVYKSTKGSSVWDQGSQPLKIESGRNELEVAVSVTNIGKRPIKSIEFTMICSTRSGTYLLDRTFSAVGPLPPRRAECFKQKFPFNKHVSAELRFATAHEEDLKITYVPTKVVYGDNLPLIKMQ